MTSETEKEEGNQGCSPLCLLRTPSTAQSLMFPQPREGHESDRQVCPGTFEGAFRARSQVIGSRRSHRKGDLLRRIGRDADALRAYERAAHLYSARGFDARAAATAKLMLTIDPSKSDVLDRVNRVAERRLRRRSIKSRVQEAP